MEKNMLKSVAAAIATLAAITPAMAQDRWDWSGGRPGDRSAYRLAGAGVPLLYPELRGSVRGRAFVLRNFDFNDDGRISPREAEAANRAFADVAGPRRDRFDWASRDRVVVVEEVRGGGWDRAAMRGYGFRDTPQGARMVLQDDVLFATDSDVLRRGAIERLRPLAAYLRANPGVRVSIDGFTDARGTAAHNQDLSERRAAAVRAAFDDMGVTRARFRVAGHGKANPVATNATAAGMRLNRRVEVTLLGQRASAFRG